MKKTSFPMQTGRRLYGFFASIRLCIVLLLLLTLDLGIGYFCLTRHNIIFEPMNRIGLFSWLATYGRANFTYTAWFFLFLPLLALLALNTLVCTTGKLVHLFYHRRQGRGTRRTRLSLSIHLMHLGLIILLAGYLVSYTMAAVYPAITLLPGRECTVAGTGLSLELLAVKPDFYTGTRLAAFTGRSINPSAEILIRDNGGEKHVTIAFNRPAWRGRYTVFLSNFSPKSAKTMNPARYIVVDIHRDPGVILYFCGLAVFLCGMAGYPFFKNHFSRQVRLI